jgi:hypothetical protein
MSKCRVSLKRTVYYDKDSGALCHCEGSFWKTCSLRVINKLPCQEAIISFTPIERTDIDPAEDSTRSLDVSLAKLQDGIRALSDKIKF